MRRRRCRNINFSGGGTGSETLIDDQRLFTGVSQPSRRESDSIHANKHWDQSGWRF